MRVSFGGHRPSVEADVEGPTEAQPDLALRLVSQYENPVLSGRLVGRDGAVLANAWFRLDVVIQDSHDLESASRMGIRTDSTGWFEVSLHGNVVAGAMGSARISHPHVGEPAQHAEVDLGAVDVARIQLGEVRLRPIER